MIPRVPLVAQVVVVFGLNLLLVVAAVLMMGRVLEMTGYAPLLYGQSASGLRDASTEVAARLADTSPALWDAVLEEASAQYGVTFLLYDRARDNIFGGEDIKLPVAVMNELNANLCETDYGGAVLPPPPPPPVPGQEAALPPPRAGGIPPLRGPRGDAVARFMIRTEEPTRYWIFMDISAIRTSGGRVPARMVLLVSSSSFTANGLLFDWRPWGVGALALVVGGVLLWVPFIRHVQHYLKGLTAATEHIAAGRFHVVIDTERGDELGKLGAALRDMALRLDGLVNDQKRFLGGIAHELCSPLARLRMALDLLERDINLAQQDYVRDAQEEAAHLAQMVDELLDFSKRSLQEETVRLRPVNLALVVNQVLRRELAGSTEVRVDVPEALTALGDEGLLVRAIGNLLRNALRHAGDGGPVRVSARRNSTGVQLTVDDNGPGVPEEALPRLFDPFYRVDRSRSRDTGGTGLGLTIVKRCLELCNGSVVARNRKPHGLSMTVTLQASPADGAEESP